MLSSFFGGWRAAPPLLRTPAIVAICLIAIGLGSFMPRATADPRRVSTPGVRLHATPLSDFYFTLRASVGGDSMVNLPASTLAASARLRGLTEYLPDSLPLRTVANTVLIVHRKNPKYTSTIDRLLWRRLDPALGTMQSAGDLPRVLPDIAASLQPLCGNAADSIRIALNELYKSAYPLYLTSTWPLHRRETSSWIREFENLFLPREREILADLSGQLGLPLGDTSQVRIFVVGSSVPDDGILFESKDRSYVSMVIPARESGYRAVGRVLRWYLNGSELLAADSSRTTIRTLEHALQAEKVSPALAREVPSALINYVIGRAVSDHCGSDELLATTGEGQTYLPALRRAWSARIAGAMSTEEACRSIAEAAARPATSGDPVSPPATGGAR